MPLYPAPLEGTSLLRLDPVSGLSGQNEALVRAAFSAIALRGAWSGWSPDVEPIAGQGKRGKERSDLFRLICEGRAAWAKYQTCGDFVGYVAAAAGVRDERYLSRDDDNLDGIPDDKQQEGDDLGPEDSVGVHHWRVSLNISMQVSGGRAFGAWTDAKDLVQASGDDPGVLLGQGDSWLIGSNGSEHVGVIVTPVVMIAPGIYAFDTVEGGQFDGAGQCVKLYHSLLRRVGGAWHITRGMNDGGRVLIGWNNCTRLPRSALAQVPESFVGLG